MVQFPLRARDFSLLQTSRPTLGYVPVPIQCEPRVSSLGVKQLGCEANYYVHLVPRLRMSAVLPTCPPYALTACQEYLQQYFHGQHLEVNNIFIMYQRHVVWQQRATLQLCKAWDHSLLTDTNSNSTKRESQIFGQSHCFKEGQMSAVSDKHPGCPLSGKLMNL